MLRKNQPFRRVSRQQRAVERWEKRAVNPNITEGQRDFAKAAAIALREKLKIEGAANGEA